MTAAITPPADSALSAFAAAARLLLGERAEDALSADHITQFADPLRRRVFVSLCQRQQNVNELARSLGRDADDIRHRLRSLAQFGFVRKLSGGYFHVAPARLKSLADYFSVLTSLGLNSADRMIDKIDLDQIFSALSDESRRKILALVTIRPRRVDELGDAIGGARTLIYYHLDILHRANLIKTVGERIVPIASVFPYLRVYFERLWLEAELGDDWLRQRVLSNSDFGL